MALGGARRYAGISIIHHVFSLRGYAAQISSLITCPKHIIAVTK